LLSVKLIISADFDQIVFVVEIKKRNEGWKERETEKRFQLFNITVNPSQVTRFKMSVRKQTNKEETKKKQRKQREKKKILYRWSLKTSCFLKIKKGRETEILHLLQFKLKDYSRNVLSKYFK
jgi:hypothetical protein